MFLEKFVLELDTKIARLTTARETIAALAGSTEQTKTTRRPRKAKAVTEPVPVAAETVVVVDAVALTAPEPVAEPAKRRGRPRGTGGLRDVSTRSYTRPEPRVTEPRALSSTIPSGPVVVSAAELARRREAVAAAREVAVAAPVMLEGSLEALIRELGERRSVA